MLGLDSNAAIHSQSIRKRKPGAIKSTVENHEALDASFQQPRQDCSSTRQNESFRIDTSLFECIG